MRAVDSCIYGCYVHSAILPTFHRRCYWLLQNPDIVLVHYLNVPYPDDNKLATVAPSLALWADKKEWTKDELVSQLKPMFFSEDEPDLNSELEISGKMFQTAETVEAIVGQLMEKQRAARAAALARQLECGCPDSTCQDSRTCAHPLRRIQAAKPPPSDHHVSSTTGPSPRPISNPPRQYTRDHRTSTQSASPLLLSLGQIQGGGGLLILNGAGNSAQQHSSLVSPLSVTSFVCEEPRDRYRHQYKPTFVLKREIPDSQPSSCLQNSDSKFEVENQVEEKVDVENFDRKIKMEPRSRNQVIASAPATPSRYPDLVERLESKILTENCDDTLVLLGTDGSLGHSSGFFDETLELSHEDIQKTLSANMPTCEVNRSGTRSSDTANVMVSGIDTMDFIESCEAVASPTQVVDDNVFVNLDAFDMLGDFPELEVLDPSSISTNPMISCIKSPPADDSNEKMQTDCANEGALSITDYSPEWAYPEGGVKVLVAGPWTDTSDQYTVLFDNFPVPSILVQNGLLRCYCPAHEAGLAALQVARGGRVVSDTVVFEYKAGPTPTPTSPASAPLPSLDFRRFSLLQRLQRLHGRLQVKSEPTDDNNQVEDVQLYSNPKFEERLVTFCKILSSRSYGNAEGFTTEPGEDNSTILHLAAVLGFTKLTTVLLRWRQDDNSLALEKEVNLGARDSDNCTPLMVASAAGHIETAVVLARWSAGTRQEAGGRAAAAAARRAGHLRLAALLDRIHPPSGDAVFRRPHCLSQKGRAGIESNLVKRPSIDSGINMADAFRSSSAIDKSDGNSSARWERSMSLPLDSDTSEDSLGDTKIGRRMDLALCETAPRRAASPLIDVEALSTASSPAASPSPPSTAGEQDDRVFTLAEQIIAAMPERIKNESSSLLSGCGLENGTGGGEDVLMVPLLDDTTSFHTEFSFEFSDNTYRYCGGSTPCSSGSVSPGSALSPPPPSPRAPLPGTPSATLQEFLNATSHFSSLTLNDREQRELYSAAITIQKAYRQYRGRQLQRRAAAAAITIQNCYRRYKQFAYLKQMHAAATVIQRGYRSLRERRLAATPVKLQNARAENGKVAQLYQDAHPSSSQHTTNTPPTPNRIIDYLAPESPMDADDDLLLELLFKT
ncbi:unnamed protein product [Parnassius mnemosyne]|uniref:CG-1 domain-containing protein n=1 Tax=Parnassius mnemosyne TaxID=213953 RepID=A0AAV1KAR0_9NEOP